MPAHWQPHALFTGHPIHLKRLFRTLFAQHYSLYSTTSDSISQKSASFLSSQSSQPLGPGFTRLHNYFRYPIVCGRLCKASTHKIKRRPICRMHLETSPTQTNTMEISDNIPQYTEDTHFFVSKPTRSLISRWSVS